MVGGGAMSGIYTDVAQTEQQPGEGFSELTKKSKGLGQFRRKKGEYSRGR